MPATCIIPEQSRGAKGLYLITFKAKLELVFSIQFRLI